MLCPKGVEKRKEDLVLFLISLPCLPGGAVYLFLDTCHAQSMLGNIWCCSLMHHVLHSWLGGKHGPNVMELKTTCKPWQPIISGGFARGLQGPH